MTKSPLMDVTLLRGYAPYTLAGYEKFRSVIESDGALPARLKALFAAVAAVDRRHLALARRELGRGVALGLTPKEATAGLIVLTVLPRRRRRRCRRPQRARRSPISGPIGKAAYPRRSSS